MRLAYLILAHQHPHLVARLIRLIDAAGARAVVHYDLNSGDAPLQSLKSQLGPLAERVLWARRTPVAWGAWSIAQATLNGLEALEQSGEAVDYVHLMSGADYPIRPLRAFAAHLEQTNGTEYIEAVDIRRQRWVRIGPEHERYLYHHHFNWRTRPWLSQRYWQLQQRLRLRRRFPAGLSPHMGSQWWTLTWSSCAKILEAGRDPKVRGFFRSVAIPDEMFFQTIVAAHVPRHRIAANGLTFSQFTDYGVPVNYYDDHFDYLARQPFFFARKIAPGAGRLRDALDGVNSGRASVPAIVPGYAGRKGTEYETARLSRRLPGRGKRIIGHVADPDIGDLACVRPFVAVMGASHEELRFVQRLLSASGAIVCHGALLGAREIDFIGTLERYAGYHRSDTRLRDQCRTTFLADVLGKSGRVPSGLTLPWHGDGGMLQLLPRLTAARTLVVRGNALRAFLETRPVATETPQMIAPDEFAAFLATVQRYHDALPKPQDGTAHADISLTSDDWLIKLNTFVGAIALESGYAGAAHIDRDLVMAAAAQLSDPARLILNADALIDMHLPPRQRRGHRIALQASEHPVPPRRSELAPDTLEDDDPRSAPAPLRNAS